MSVFIEGGSSMANAVFRGLMRMVFLLALVACGGGSGADDSTGTTDSTPPTVISISPSDGASNVSLNPVITVTFSETMNAASITNGTLSVNGVTGNVSANGSVATFTPLSALTNSTGYTVTVLGGASGVKDAAGNPLAVDFTSSFTTEAAPVCNSATVLCVDDTPGINQEYATIQSAVDVASAGDTVLVFDGTYTGFVVSSSGISDANRITVKAQGSAAIINAVNSVGEGIRVTNSDFVTIEGFVVTGMPVYGLTARGATATSPMHGVVFRGNTVTNSGSTNIYTSQVADSLIEGNTASGSGASHGIYLANGGSDNTIIRGNRLFNNAKNGIHLNGDLSVGGDGIHSGITIENNVVFDNVDNGLDLDGMQDSLVRNNLIYNNGRHALRVFQLDAAVGARNLTIINNTFVVAATGGGSAIKLTADGGGHTIFNNILHNAGSGGSIVVGHANFKSDNNIVVNNGFSLDGGNTTLSFAQWQAAGYDAASVVSTAAALFVAPSTGNYTLNSDALAVNAGLASLNGVLAPSLDILGVSRPQGGGVDIGAYESPY